MFITVTGRLFTQLDQEAAQHFLFLYCNLCFMLKEFLVIKDYKLDWYLDDKHHFGWPEIQIMIIEALQHSTGTGCLVKMQIIIAVLFTFNLSCQLSSMAPSVIKFLEQGKIIFPHNFSKFLLISFSIAHGTFQTF
jgi:hypothetical protein